MRSKWHPRKNVLSTAESRWFLGASISIYLITVYIVTVCSNLASYLSPSITTYPILPDLGFKLIPQFKMLWLTDLFSQIPVVPTFLYIALIDPTPLPSIARIGFTLSIAYLLRSLTIIITSLPDPRPDCIRITRNLFTTFTLHRCGDCIFSGHLAALTVFLLFWVTSERTSYRLLRASLRLMTFACVILGCWAILANRTHYTVDILVAIYTTMGIWWSISYFWKTKVIEKNRLGSIIRLYKPINS